MKGRRGGLALFCSPHWQRIVRPVQGVWGYTNKVCSVSNGYKGKKAHVNIVLHTKKNTCTLEGKTHKSRRLRERPLYYMGQ